jgi:hypothetical protein
VNGLHIFRRRGVGSRSASVAIYRLLQKSAFGPEDTKRMGDAYELALIQLELKNRYDPLTEDIARFIVEIAQTGEKDPNTICARALSLLRGDLKAC